MTPMAMPALSAVVREEDEEVEGWAAAVLVAVALVALEVRERDVDIWGPAVLPVAGDRMMFNEEVGLEELNSAMIVVVPKIAGSEAVVSRSREEVLGIMVVKETSVKIIDASPLGARVELMSAAISYFGPQVSVFSWPLDLPVRDCSTTRSQNDEAQWSKERYQSGQINSQILI